MFLQKSEVISFFRNKTSAVVACLKAYLVEYLQMAASIQRIIVSFFLTDQVSEQQNALEVVTYVLNCFGGAIDLIGNFQETELPTISKNLVPRFCLIVTNVFRQVAAFLNNLNNACKQGV